MSLYSGEEMHKGELLGAKGMLTGPAVREKDWNCILVCGKQSSKVNAVGVSVVVLHIGLEAGNGVDFLLHLSPVPHSGD